jgi:DNA repair protein RecO
MLSNPVSDINQTEGVVIRSHASGESDLVLKILTPTLGKIALFVKHARKSKKRFAGNIEILDRGIFSIRNANSKTGGSLYFVESFQAVKPLHTFRTNLLKLSIASLLCESFDLIIKEEQDSQLVSAQFYEAFSLGIDSLEESEVETDLLKICFISLKALLCIAGFLDNEIHVVPNKKNLKIILSQIENCVEKRLLSRDEFEKLI